MRWLELGLAVLVGALVVAFQVLPRTWCEPLSVRAIAALNISPIERYWLALMLGCAVGYFGQYLTKYFQL
jgi:hypothetical protein